MKQLLVRLDNPWWGAQITGEMSQLSDRCAGHKIGIGIIEGVVIAFREV